MPDHIADALEMLRTAKTTARDALAMLDQITGEARPDVPADPRAMLAEAKRKLGVVQGLHLELAHKLLQLEQEHREQHQMRFDDPVYWRQMPGGERLGPYCTICWDATGKAITLSNSPFRGHDRWICRVCAKTFFSPGARDALEASASAHDRGPGRR